MTIWIDATVLREWGGKPHGIARVEVEAIRHLLKERNTRFFVWEHFNSMRKITHEEVAQMLRFSNAPMRSREYKESNQPLHERIVQILYQRVFSRTGFCRFLLASSAYLALFIWRLAFQAFNSAKILSRDLARSITNELSILFGGTRPGRASWFELHRPADLAPLKGFDLEEGDTLLSLGLLWKRADLKAIYREKKTRRFKVGLFIHDLIPIRNPDLAFEPHLKDFYDGVTDCLWLADYIFVNSDHVFKDLQDFQLSQKIGSSAEIAKVSLGLDHLSPANRTEKLMALAPKKYVVFVSTIEKRKNHKLLLDVYERLIKSAGSNLPDLVIVGAMGWGTEDIVKEIESSPSLRLGGERKLRILSNLEDAEVSWLYENALYSVFPSITEGWGLPVSESLYFGTPVIASDHPAVIEAGLNLATHLRPTDTDAWVTLMSRWNKNIPAKQRNIKLPEIPTWEQFASDVTRKIGK